MENCCHAWAGALGCHLHILDKLQNRVCWALGPSFAASFKPWVHCRKVTSWGLFESSITLVDVHLNWQSWSPFLIFMGGQLVILIVLYDFSISILRCYRDFSVSTFFLTQPYPGICCLQNAFLWPMILMVVSLKSISTFYLWVLSI